MGRCRRGDPAAWLAKSMRPPPLAVRLAFPLRRDRPSDGDRQPLPFDKAEIPCRQSLTCLREGQCAVASDRRIRKQDYAPPLQYPPAGTSGAPESVEGEMVSEQK